MPMRQRWFEIIGKTGPIKNLFEFYHFAYFGFQAGCGRASLGDAKLADTRIEEYFVFIARLILKIAAAKYWGIARRPINVIRKS